MRGEQSARPHHQKPPKNETMNTYTETIDLPHGYTAEIATDECPANPFEEWDCEMPIAVCYGGGMRRGVNNYNGDTLNLETLLTLMPDNLWTTRTGKRAIMHALDISPRSAAEWMAWEYQNHGSASFVDCVASFAEESAFFSWQDYFDAMEAVSNLAGIPCHLTTSTGYCQGDYALVFAAALPAWVEKVGAPPETLADQCRATVDLWSAWAWGDVYGIRAIIAPDGEKLDDGSVWGFYGTEHEKSGLLDCAKETVNAHREYLARESAAAFEAACRDIDTPALPLHLSYSA
jgi:hypothetical protein